MTPQRKFKKSHALEKTPDGYICTRAGQPTFVAERCPEDSRKDYPNVIALIPVRVMDPREAFALLAAAAHILGGK